MKIHRLYIQNFRGIEKIELNMDGRSAVIFGIVVYTSDMMFKYSCIKRTFSPRDPTDNGLPG